MRNKSHVAGKKNDKVTGWYLMGIADEEKGKD
jgi:hypothetical protein